MHFASEIKKENRQKDEQHTKWVKHCVCVCVCVVFVFHSLNFIGWDEAKSAHTHTHIIRETEYRVRSLYQPMWRLKGKKFAHHAENEDEAGGNGCIVSSALLLSSHFLFFLPLTLSFTILSLTLSHWSEIALTSLFTTLLNTIQFGFQKDGMASRCDAHESLGIFQFVSGFFRIRFNQS